MVYQTWWKALGVVLLVYTFIAGMLIPLKPGISSVHPSNAATGEEVVLEINGYNTLFTRSGAEVRAWLKMDDAYALGASGVEIVDDQHIRARFYIPAFLPDSGRVRDFTLLLDDPFNGACVLPSAVFITQDSIDPAMGKAQWVNAPIKGLHANDGLSFPFRNILKESIRNTYFHVPLWFAMVFLFLFSVGYSVRYLRTGTHDNDRRAHALAVGGVLFGMMGLVTGAIWAKNTWGAYWSWDVKQNMTAIALLIYFAYFILRGSFEDPEKRARLAAVYNLFAFVALIPLIYVIPRLTDSLHPGSGGNPAFGSDDLDNTMRMVFYPAILGWTLLGFWIASVVYRMERLRDRVLEFY
ncbi:MAG: cytochrome c biogenesis protein CcsA [Haliscomenobacter sp.]|nr:cytochrome c biogenesis protein CcsA [Haliscomenobacter sp.]